MPQFIPEHTSNGLDDFTRGYLECAEWLLDEEVNRDKLRGFPRASVKSAKEDCRAFLKAYAAELETYQKLSGRDLSHAGHDFWLSRNGHGAGFFDRGSAPVFDVLQGAARGHGGIDTYVYRGWIYFA